MKGGERNYRALPAAAPGFGRPFPFGSGSWQCLVFAPGDCGRSVAGDGTIRLVVLNLRLPRILIAVLTGCALSLSGALLQAVMRNPLADPGIIGVSAGAVTAATTVMLLAPKLLLLVPLFAFGGALLACVIIYLLAWKRGVDPVRIILSGVAVNAVLGSYTSFLQLLNADNLSGVLGF